MCKCHMVISFLLRIEERLLKWLHLFRIVEKNDGFVVIDKESLKLLQGSTFDYSMKDLVRFGFVIMNNPNAAKTCGCGKSWDAKMPS